jgi:hypothetical protein
MCDFLGGLRGQARRTPEQPADDDGRRAALRQMIDALDERLAGLDQSLEIVERINDVVEKAVLVW